MLTCKKTRIRKKLNKKYSRKKNYKGGLLMMNSETDLINTHMCNLKSGKIKETIGDEIYTYNGTIVQLNMNTIGFVQQIFKKTEDRWFKFVVFNNDGEDYIYLINGGKINKHSVCMLIGLLDVTHTNNEYNEIRETVKMIDNFKLSYLPQEVFNNEGLLNELNMLKSNLDNLVNRDIKCMPVISAGSGTVNEDGSICINNKSGHYKPTIQSMEIAKRVFDEKTGVSIFVKEKISKDVLKDKYGENYDFYSGMCI